MIIIKCLIIIWKDGKKHSDSKGLRQKIGHCEFVVKECVAPSVTHGLVPLLSKAQRNPAERTLKDVSFTTLFDMF